MAAVPSKENITDPAGTPVPDAGCTSAVNVTLMPCVCRLPSEVKVVVVGVKAILDPKPISRMTLFATSDKYKLPLASNARSPG